MAQDAVVSAPDGTADVETRVVFEDAMTQDASVSTTPIDGAVDSPDDLSSPSAVPDDAMTEDASVSTTPIDGAVDSPDDLSSPSAVPDAGEELWNGLGGAGSDAAIDSLAGSPTLPRVLGSWDFELDGDTVGWTGVRDCPGGSLSGRCALVTDSTGLIAFSIPGYVAMAPYRIALWVKGSGSVFGQVFDSPLWKRFSVVFRVPSATCTFSVYAAVGKEARIDKVTLEAVTWREQVAYSDAVMDELGVEVAAQTDADRFQYLSKTMDRFGQGLPVHILFLGDSLANDTFTGQWEALIRRGFPTAQIQATLSIRGSTGVAWYALENRLADYVYQYKPDLVYIGGISNGVDPEAWLSVIHQIQTNLPDAEILVGSSASAFWMDPDSSKVVAGVAAEGKVAFLDSALYFRKILDDLGIAAFDSSGNYAGTGDNWQILGRDAAVHQNNRGSEVLARIFATFFTGQPR